MDYMQITKQMMELNKGAFDNSFKTMIMLQEQAEKYVFSFLEKATWTLAGTLVVLSVIITSFIPKATQSTQSEIKEQVNNAVAIDPNTVAPNFGTAQQSSANPSARGPGRRPTGGSSRWPRAPKA